MTPRIYVNEVLAVGKTICLPKEPSSHLLKVLRCVVGDACHLFNGEGSEYHARISCIEKSLAVVCIDTEFSVERENTTHIHLFHGIARGEKMDWIIQKATEMGVNELTPIYTQKNVVKFDADRSEKKQRHWQQIIIHSSEQCGRNRLMTLHAPMAFAKAIQQPFEGLSLLCEPSWPERKSMHEHQSIRLFIGGESGFSSEELCLAQAQGFESFSLGPRILRTETAAIVAVSLLTL